MTQCRSWPLYGLLALALVVRAGWADDEPAAKEAKPAGCCKAKQKEQCPEECSIEEAIKKLVHLGQMCNPCDDENSDCSKCPLTTPKNRISVGLGLRCLAGVPALVPSIEFECTKDCSKTVCKPCPTTETEPTEFRVQTKVVHHNGKKAATLLCPAVTVSAGQRASVFVGQNAGCVAPQGGALPASLGILTGCTPPGCLMNVEVKQARPGYACLDLSVVQNPQSLQEMGQERVAHCAMSAIETTIPLGRIVKLPLHAVTNGAKGKMWVEVEVNRVPEDATCVPPIPAVRSTPYSVPINPQMMTLRAFRNADGQLVVEPPPPCPMPCAPASAAYNGSCVYRAVAAQPVHMPMPVGAPLPPPAVVPCAAVTCAERHCGDSVVRAVMEDGRSFLQMKAGADCCVSFSDLTLGFPGCSPCELTANGERVEISTPFASASADCVKVEMGRNFIQLEGNVKITYHAKGRDNSACADKACLHLSKGNMTINLEVNEKESD